MSYQKVTDPMQQWVRDLIAAIGLSGPDAETILSRELGAGYSRFTLYKMTKSRRITMAEALALSRATGYPLPTEMEDATNYDQRFAALSPDRRAVLEKVLEGLEAAEALDRAKRQSAHVDAVINP